MVLPQAMAWVQYWFRILSLKFCGKSKKICGDISPQSPAFCIYAPPSSFINIVIISTICSNISVFWQRVNIQIALPYRNPQQHKSKAAIWRNQEDIEKLKYTSNPCCGKSYVERIEKKSGQRIPVVMHRRKTMIGNTCCNGWLARGSNHLQIRAGKLGLLVLEVHSTSEPGTKSKSLQDSKS